MLCENIFVYKNKLYARILLIFSDAKALYMVVYTITAPFWRHMLSKICKTANQSKMQVIIKPIVKLMGNPAEKINCIMICWFLQRFLTKAGIGLKPLSNQTIIGASSSKTLFVAFFGVIV